ncbi:MAG: DUF2550 domain-containing protein [Gordonia sp. (in: high G+C Gram-positive bacteria)]|uniref:DUF2550 domain-containing protein n=1 Tax=Gordonia sp. (in: high G+C Gram-positive bacteria) TaxID=84139 RepID=UPI003BB7A121
MTWWGWLILAVAAIGAFLVGGLFYRIREVRSAGTPVLFRSMPAGRGQGWRHGSVHYTEDALVYYRLSSLRPGPTAVLPRRRVEITARRTPEGSELEIMDTAMVVLDVQVTVSTHRVVDYEIAMERVLVTALLSWLESRSPERSRRRRGA